MDFIIDTVGDTELNEKDRLINEEDVPFVLGNEKELIEFFHTKKEELDAVVSAEEELQRKLKGSKVDEQIEEFFAEMGWNNLLMIRQRKPLFQFDQLDKDTGKLKSKLGEIDVDKELENAILQPGIEKKRRLPKYSVSERILKERRKKNREKTKGPEWFNMKAPEMTKDLKNDLQVLKMRSAVDPKHFYKKNDMATLPKYFQMGRIMDSPLDHVNERITKKQRKRTMVEELLADAEFQKNNKRKYKEIIDEKRKNTYKTHMREKRKTIKMNKRKESKIKKKQNAT